MSSDDSPSDDASSGDDVRERIETEAEELDQRLVDLLAWVLDTETRARIYIELRQHPERTSEEIAEGTGLYPSTVREALAALHEDGTVTRGKRKETGAGNNPYEYEAIKPADLVGDVVEEVQRELNTVFNLDAVLGDGGDDGGGTGPVTVSVTEEDDA